MNEIKLTASRLETFIAEEDLKIQMADKLRDELEKVHPWRIFKKRELLRRYAEVVDSFRIG